MSEQERFIPRTRAWETEETPVPKPDPKVVALQKTKQREPTVTAPPLESSRATVAVFLTIVLLGLIGLFLYWYTGTVRSLDRTVVAASQQRVKSADALLKGKAAAKVAPTVGIGRPTTDRTIAPATLEVGGIVVGISLAEIGSISVNNRETETEYLRLTVRVTNLLGNPFSLVGVHSAGTKAILRDSSGNYFNHIRFSPSELPKGCITKVDIPPKDTVTDLLVFENPGIQIGKLGQPFRPGDFELDLPLGGRNYRFLIPGSMFQRPSPTMRPAQVVQPPPAPPTRSTPPPTTKEPTLTDLLREDYDRLWTQAVRKAKALSSDRVRDYLRRRKQEILTDLAEKYNLPRSEVVKLLP